MSITHNTLTMKLLIHNIKTTKTNNEYFSQQVSAKREIDMKAKGFGILSSKQK
jgi:hypothetical protein